MNLIYSEHFTSCSGVLTNTWAWSLIHFEIVTKSLMILVVGEHCSALSTQSPPIAHLGHYLHSKVA